MTRNRRGSGSAQISLSPSTASSIHAGLHRHHGQIILTYHTLEMKKQSKQWISKGSRAALRPRCTPVWPNRLALELEHLPYLPDLAPADFSLFRRVKEGLGDITLDQEILKNDWEGVTRNITSTAPRPSGGGLGGLKSVCEFAGTSSRILQK